MARAITACLALLVAAHSWAGQAQLDKSYIDAIAQIDKMLAATDVTLIEQANTDKFTLVLGSHTSGTRVTLALRSSPDGMRALVNVATDSPKNAALEARILAELAKGPLD